jgi:hypothetical protein
MKVYKLAWMWYEDDEYYLFTHPKSNQKKFDQDVRDILRKYGNDYINKESWNVGASGWVKYAAGKLPELGYVPVSVTSCIFSGAYSIEKKFQSKELSEDTKRWQEVVGVELTKKAIDKNRKIKAKMRIAALAERKEFAAQESKK